MVFVGFWQTSKSKYLFNDTASELYTLNTDQVDFCGTKKFSFTLNSINTALLSGSNGGKISLRTENSLKSYGQAVGQLRGYLQSYPKVMSDPVSFKVTLLGSVAPEIPIQTYNTESEALKIKFDSF